MKTPYLIREKTLTDADPNNTLFFKVPSNRRVFLNSLAKKLNITDQEGWYKITKQTLKQHGGSGLFEYYNNSVSEILKNLFPEYL